MKKHSRPILASLGHFRIETLLGLLMVVGLLAMELAVAQTNAPATTKTISENIIQLLRTFTPSMLPRPEEEIFNVMEEATEVNGEETASSWFRSDAIASGSVQRHEVIYLPGSPVPAKSEPPSGKSCTYLGRTVTYRNCQTGEITRVVTYDAEGNVVSTETPKNAFPPVMSRVLAPKSAPSSPIRISSQNIETQLRDGKPDTFYIAPGNYRTLMLVADIGLEDNIHFLRLSVPLQARFKISNYKGGLKAWNVNQLPKNTKKVILRLEYRLPEFQPEKGNEAQAAITIAPAFGTRQQTLVDAANALTVKNITTEWTPLEESFLVPRDAIQFLIRAGFSGGDRGTFDLRNVSVTVEETAKPSPTATPSPTPAPTPLDTATPAPNKPITQGIPTGQENVPSDNPDFEQRVFQLVNQERAQRGLSEYNWNENLARAARYHALDMATDDYFSHDTMDRVDGDLKFVCKVCWRTYYFDKSSAGENIAAGQNTPEQVVADWMASPGHRANILGATFDSIGVGYVKGHWVQYFGLKTK